MFPNKPNIPDLQNPIPRTVDWIILAASLVGFLIVIAASIGAGKDGLAANLGSFVATAVF